VPPEVGDELVGLFAVANVDTLVGMTAAVTSQIVASLESFIALFALKVTLIGMHKQVVVLQVTQSLKQTKQIEGTGNEAKPWE